MVKRLPGDRSGAPVFASPGLQNAPVLDLMCSHFVLTLPRDGSHVEGSPIPLAPREGEAAPFGALGLTQPIHVSDGAS